MNPPAISHGLRDSPTWQQASGVKKLTQPHARAWLSVAFALSTFFLMPTWAADPQPASNKPQKTPAKKPTSGATDAKTMAEQVQEAIESSAAAKKRLMLTVNNKDKKMSASLAAENPAPSTAPKRPLGGPLPPVLNPIDSHQYIRAKAAEMAAAGTASKVEKPISIQPVEAQWGYSGETGPQAWGQLKPEFQTCSTGTRQSPINIEDSTTLQGPAEALHFRYQPSAGSVINNGHTIQVDVQGENTLTVRGSEYKLVQFHFHTPSEERINHRSFAMTVHLLHRNPEGQLAILAVLLEPGVANSLIHAVWTHMPLDVGDRVRLPISSINLQELLPQDQRYYQFLGSLTTPPCTEGVLWIVMKQPTSVSREQIRLFAQLFPNNARPVQPLNGRAVREAQ